MLNKLQIRRVRLPREDRVHRLRPGDRAAPGLHRLRLRLPGARLEAGGGMPPALRGAPLRERRHNGWGHIGSFGLDNLSQLHVWVRSLLK